jgi:hypothetical protein
MLILLCVLLQEQLHKLAVQVSEQKVVEAQEHADELAESKQKGEVFCTTI